MRSGAAGIERLGPGDGARLRAVRLRALREDPDAFETTFAEVADRPTESWERQIEQLATFVAIADGFLDVGERNAPAIALYARKGFVPTGERASLPPPREHVREIRMVVML